MKKKSKLISSLLIGTCLFTLVACGNDDDDSGSAGAGQQQEQQQDDQGIYRAVLAPLNTNVAGNTTGTVEITIEGDDFVAESNGANSPAGVKHLHNITFATACPTAASDLNGDSYIDIAEALPSTGPILIPLDSDLSNQLDGNSYGPIANNSGSYYHRRSTSLTDLLADLTAPDPDPADPYVKLPEGQQLNLAGRVILVHGVSASKNLPDSVASFGELAAEQTLPIACGQLVRVTDEGGNTEPETVPAEVEETTDLN